MRRSTTYLKRGAQLALGLHLTVGCGSNATPIVAECPTGTSCTRGDGLDSGAPPVASTDSGPATRPQSDELSGVPCKVREVLEARCVSCHATVPVFSAPMAL